MFNFLSATPVATENAIDSSLGFMSSIFTWILNTAMSHPLIATFFVSGLIGLGFGIFKKLKRG